MFATVCGNARKGFCLNHRDVCIAWGWWMEHSPQRSRGRSARFRLKGPMHAVSMPVKTIWKAFLVWVIWEGDAWKWI